MWSLVSSYLGSKPLVLLLKLFFLLLKFINTIFESSDPSSSCSAFASVTIATPLGQCRRRGTVSLSETVP